MPIPSAIGIRIKACRDNYKLSLRDLAERCDTITYSYIGQLERGLKDNPTVGTIEELARALNVNPSWLAFGKGKP